MFYSPVISLVSPCWDLKEAENDKYKFLILQYISREDLKNGNLEDFVRLAQDQEAAYYYLDKENFESIDVGQRVKITADFNQNESNPPIRAVLDIEKINE
ncbi:DUF3221 domain-containing protein [Paenibacillus taichungensis]|uniref:DUF3221 domain-containing protein n=1 Tax=Paenibacillus TaxID=44249 RepID=UPI00096C8057|nr:DUF3221 domain-containing protein [Paenibacillus taichungensis]MEC0111093.1 DUF3221 domain-containing protein [Paenibacillus taichungensis]MEC0196892.1 DUF3221 domain-containing protein [Paenibacillus taichungensis]OME83701.1 hypothetical protein BK122_09805 [Paenibacillus pabuli]